MKITGELASTAQRASVQGRSPPLAAGRIGSGRAALLLGVARRWIDLTALLAGIAVLSACASLSPDDPAAVAQSERLIKEQDDQAAQVADKALGRRIWLAGFAMGSTSTAFQGDLDVLSHRLSALGGPFLKYQHSNEPQTRTLRYPFADLRTMREAIRHIAARAAAEDIVVVLVSTHGSQNVLSVNVARKERDGITDAQLSEVIAPLGDRPTVVILSACYSGSFIPELHRDTRIVLTSASAQRASFGCDTSGRNTVFIEELAAHGFDARKSLLQLMVRAKARIAERESSLGLPHSEPQVSVGPKVLWLMDRPLKDWFEPGMAFTGPIARLSENGKAGYARYLNRPYPSAFAIASDGTWSAEWGPSRDPKRPDDPAERALEACRGYGGKDCRLFSRDSQLVWPSEDR